MLPQDQRPQGALEGAEINKESRKRHHGPRGCSRHLPGPNLGRTLTEFHMLDANANILKSCRPPFVHCTTQEQDQKRSENEPPVLNRRSAPRRARAGRRVEAYMRTNGLRLRKRTGTWALCALFSLASTVLVAPTEASATPIGAGPFAPGSVVVSQGGDDLRGHR